MELVTRSVGIIGTGNMARALAKRLIFSGYKVVLGSRRPEDRQQLLLNDMYTNDVEITAISSCIERNEIIFVALHVEFYSSILVADLDGKILVDISNQTRVKNLNLSNAEYLSSLVPNGRVVKAFNVLPAFVIENDATGGPRRVFVAGDHASAKDAVCSVARDMGFEPVNLGALASSRKMEMYVLTLFPLWRLPFVLMLIVLTIWLVYVVYFYFMYKKVYNWHQIFIHVTNKVLCTSAITLLSMTYLPGSIAAFIQIFYGTKYRRFPEWFTGWLSSRKQLGLLTFSIALIHSLMSILVMSPAYYMSWYQPTNIIVRRNFTDDQYFPLKPLMIWKGEAASLFGILAIFCMSVLAVGSIPSVSNTLNWREWRFLQSSLGYLTLLLAVIHVFIMATPNWIKLGFPKMLYSIGFVSVALPVITLILKFAISLPCVNNYVTKIRIGWERAKPSPQI
ncbi:unnamed protein product [Didymodactylos carnosus]|uniref:Pyrroline-5-carboxylate reductase catalytic N-terminal domain-containing protein n=1 Tax=Didymodactylos carnosus TaxID=1234261 RepID=A0A8S2H3Y2_9BILA|nr:unnamed protein product [Didymodactylos carnosus]CAF3592190.1 unnamed protein product [Didymodactylos carnosus]